MRASRLLLAWRTAAVVLSLSSPENEGTLMDLYTSLVRLKQSMNGGELPPMTDVPASALLLIDPSFTPGMGALEEDETRGLRCPVRGCGRYFHALSTHITRAHSDIGGTARVRTLLSIPTSARLCSRKLSEKKSALVQGRTYEWRHPAPFSTRATDIKRRHKSIATATMGARNLRNRCEAQLRHALIDVQNRLGRSPNQREVISMLPNGDGVVKEIRQAYGSFNSFKLQIGLETFGNNGTASQKRRSAPRVTRDMVLEALSAWYEVHKALPSMSEVERAVRVPALPNKKTIMRAMGTEAWPEAMRRAASLLNIYGGRYGLPERVA